MAENTDMLRLSPARMDTRVKPRRVAKIEWHPGELYPRVGFIVTNMARSAENVVGFYNKRGTCEQWIKEGKGAIKWTRLSCRSFAANARQFPAHFGDARADQGLVADEPKLIKSAAQRCRAMGLQEYFEATADELKTLDQDGVYLVTCTSTHHAVEI